MSDEGQRPATGSGERGPHPGAATRLREPWSRGRVLHLLLVVTLALSVPAALGTLASTRGGRDGVPVALLATQAAFVLLLLALVVVNRRGRTTLAAWVFCGALVLNGSEFLALADLDRTLVIYAPPIIVAAFLLRPASAYSIFALSVADYLIAFAGHAGEHPFNWLSVLTLGGVAIAAWAGARRTAWFEEGERLYRRELDRAMADLEALEARVSSLRKQLESERGAAPQASAASTASSLGTSGGRSCATVSQRMRPSTPKYS